MLTYNKNLDAIFDVFATSLYGPNYVVIVAAQNFHLLPGSSITQDTLQKAFGLVDGHMIAGLITTCSFLDACSEIRDGLSYAGNSGSIINSRVDANELVKREGTFWSLVDTYLPISPEKVYRHVPLGNSGLDLGHIWNFCYIFVKGNNALAIAMGASD